jgi:phosphatidylserine decarboxylase
MSGGRGERLFVGIQYVLPQHALSRLVLAATRVRARWFKNLLTRGFLKLYPVDLTEAVEPDPLAYPSFNAFFTRALKAAARPVCAGTGAIASPVDGTVSECGRIEGDSLLQAKGRRYTLADLLAGQDWAKRFESGSFATIYLAPFNYHRVHMPTGGRLLDAVYVPGRLFSVNAATARHVPRLFARNERVLMRFEGAAGHFVVVMVGALNVGSISTVWAGDVAPSRRRRVTALAPTPVMLERGAELGRFNMGSTVILLYEPGRAVWTPGLRAGVAVRLGEAIGGAP